MDLIKKIELFIGEDGDVYGNGSGGAGTTTPDVAKLPQGTPTMKKRKKKKNEDEDEVKKKEDKDTDTLGEL